MIISLTSSSNSSLAIAFISPLFATLFRTSTTAPLQTLHLLTFRCYFIKNARLDRTLRVKYAQQSGQYNNNNDRSFMNNIIYTQKVLCKTCELEFPSKKLMHKHIRAAHSKTIPGTLSPLSIFISIPSVISVSLIMTIAFITLTSIASSVISDNKDTY